ncbi:hypothetical protein PSEHALCIP103_03682 [Pseudoalteromonas haloplanktis]|jgi:hypothetical protein|uniref:Uncharacterized protein n=1 Tax=Pseudoalteromonas haloplanktis TaxID=228 RepID=A0A9W4R5G4_PSEHA|nr:hypothetical protein PSEHALCIP103_03682 [Pseudoalteromonas haloplanktis]
MPRILIFVDRPKELARGKLPPTNFQLHLQTSAYGYLYFISNKYNPKMGNRQRYQRY